MGDCNDCEVKMTEEVEDDEMNVSVGDEEFGIGNSTFNSVAPLDETFESSFEEGADDPAPLTSTPVKDKGKGGRFKVPKPPPSKYFKKCGPCGRYIITERGWKTHERTHRWKGTTNLLLCTFLPCTCCTVWFLHWYVVFQMPLP